MSVTLKQGLMKYKNGQGEFVSINSISEQATTQQVANINSAGAAQVAAVQLKGEQTLASIPVDYTNLSNEVNDVKSALTNVNDSILDITGNKAIEFSDFASKKYLNTSGSTVNFESLSTANVNVKYAVVPCSPGDQFNISGKGGNADRLYAFTDSTSPNHNIISSPKAGAGATEDKLVITAPTNSAYLVINTETDKQSYYGNKLIIDKVEKLQKDLMASISPTQTALEWTKGGEKGVSPTYGTLVDSTVCAYTDFIDVSIYQSITYKRFCTTGSTIYFGMAWYSEPDTSAFIGGLAGVANASSDNPIDYTDNVPATAKYARFTYRKDTQTYGNFSITGISKTLASINKVDAKVETLSNKITKDYHVPFEYSYGTKLNGTSPYMGTEKYGIKTLSELKELKIKTMLYLGKGCHVTYTLKDENGTTWGSAITKDYSAASAGDAVDVDITFTFDTGLPEGKYYLWINSDEASSLGYKYESTFPSAYKFIELTNDGGYSTSVNATSLTTYNMFLAANISGISVVNEPAINVDNVLIENPSALDGHLNLNGWTQSGDTLSINHTGSGNSFFQYSIDKSVLKTYYLKTTCYLTIANGSKLILWLIGKNASNETIYISLADDVSESGAFERLTDLNNLAIYNSLDLTKEITIGFGNQTSSCVASVTGFSVEAYNVTIEETDLVGALSRIDLQVKSDSSSVEYLLATNNMLKAPNGSTFLLAVANDGTIRAINTIPNKTLFIGNSLLLGNGIGMNASNASKDYYHIVCEAILEKDNTATFEKLNGTSFESCASTSAADTWMSNTLSGYLDNELDLVIIQLGDNVTASKVSVFAETCGNLIRYIREHAPNARVAWAGEWYSSTERQQIISDACIRYGAVFIDISVLNKTGNRSYIGAIIQFSGSVTRTYTMDSYTDDSTNHILTINFTVNGKTYTAELPYTSYTASDSSITVTGNYMLTTDPGVASHPGDEGMLAVANTILSGLGIE